MRFKTLGVVLISAMALFTAFYWITDPGRRETAYVSQKDELLAYGLEMFGAPIPANKDTANCAKCHGADGRGGTLASGRQAPNLHSKSILAKLKLFGGRGSFLEIRRPGDDPDYVNLVIRFGGIVVSGDPKSPMPAWSLEVGGALTVHQIDALTALVESWVLEAASQPDEEVPNTVEAGRSVYSTAGCAGCHGPNQAGVGQFPSLVNIGNQPVIDLPFPITDLAKLQADYAADADNFLKLWIRDSWTNYNGGATTNMPKHPAEVLSDSALQALVTFLLSLKQ